MNLLEIATEYRGPVPIELIPRLVARDEENMIVKWFFFVMLDIYWIFSGNTKKS